MPPSPRAPTRSVVGPVVTVLVLAVLALLVLSLLRSATTSSSEQGQQEPTATAGGAAGTALAALARLPVRPLASHTGYSREQYGTAWADVDHNGCDTRDDVLARDLVQTTTERSDACEVASGVLHDPYTGRTIDFRRGPETSSTVQIDHVVALSDAWMTGAQQWSATVREHFANDPLNLLAVDGPTNQAKGDGDASTWLPPQQAFDCPYVARQVAVKVKYGAWVTQAEHDAVARVLRGCPSQRLPVDDGGVAAG